MDKVSITNSVLTLVFSSFGMWAFIWHILNYKRDKNEEKELWNYYFHIIKAFNEEGKNLWWIQDERIGSKEHVLCEKLVFKGLLRREGNNKYVINEYDKWKTP